MPWCWWYSQRWKAYSDSPHAMYTETPASATYPSGERRTPISHAKHTSALEESAAYVSQEFVGPNAKVVTHHVWFLERRNRPFPIPDRPPCCPRRSLSPVGSPRSGRMALGPPSGTTGGSPNGLAVPPAAAHGPPHLLLSSDSRVATSLTYVFALK